MNYSKLFEDIRNNLETQEMLENEAGPYHLSYHFVDATNMVCSIRLPASVYRFEYSDREDQDKAEQMIRTYLRHVCSIRCVPLDYEEAMDIFNRRP